MAVAVIFKIGTIPAGQSLSNAIDCTAGAPVMLFVPPIWTPAQLSYQVSPDGTNFFDLHDRLGKEITVNLSPGSAVRLNPEWTDAALGAWIKLRSGSRAAPAIQVTDRVFTLMVNTNP